jgi:hypothetical protein
MIQVSHKNPLLVILPLPFERVASRFDIGQTQSRNHPPEVIPLDRAGYVPLTASCHPNLRTAY